jgi:hypothetical protein
MESIGPLTIIINSTTGFCYEIYSNYNSIIGIITQNVAPQNQTYSSFGLLSTGNPVILCNTNAKILYNYSTSLDGDTGTWNTIELYDGTIFTQSFNLLSTTNYPCFSYVISSTCYFAKSSSSLGLTGTWSNFVVDSGGFLCNGSSLSILNGNPCISYIKNTIPSSELRFAYSSNVDGSGVWTLVTLDTNLNPPFPNLYQTSLRILSTGYPAIVFYNFSSLIYFYSSSTTGALGSWNSVIIDNIPISVIYIGLNGSLFILSNGNPAISYYDQTNGYLKFAYSSNPNGINGSWTTIIIDSTANVGAYSSLGLLKTGFPCISYYDLTNNRLKFAYSNNISGILGSWTIVPLDINSGVGNSFHLLSNGNPALSTIDNSTFNYLFRRMGYYNINYIT